jgi:hypothetical protein
VEIWALFTWDIEGYSLSIEGFGVLMTMFFIDQSKIGTNMSSSGWEGYTFFIFAYIFEHVTQIFLQLLNIQILFATCFKLGKIWNNDLICWKIHAIEFQWLVMVPLGDTTIHHMGPREILGEKSFIIQTWSWSSIF